MGSSRGQATIDYVVVVALVALVLAVGGTAVAAPGVANAVVSSVRRALCIVTGGGCTTVRPRPCTVRSESRDERVTVYAGVIRLGDHAGLLREVLSDGSVRITQIDDLEAGLNLGVGGEAHLHVGGIAIGTGEVAGAAAMGELGTRRSWLLPDSAAADRLVARLRGATGIKVVDDPVKAVTGLLGLDGEEDRPPAADEVTISAGAKGLAELHGDGGIIDADLNLVSTLSAGGVWNRRTGQRTVLLRGNASATLQLSRGIFKGRLREIDRVGAAIVLARDGTPLELIVSAAGQVDRGKLGSLSLKGVTTNRRAGLRGEADARLDLTVTENLALTRRALAALATHPLPGAGMAFALPALMPLLARLEEDGRIDVRTYAGSALSAGGGVSGAAGGRIGGEVEVSSDTLRLLEAWSRPPGGVWEERVDCTGA